MTPSTQPMKQTASPPVQRCVHPSRVVRLASLVLVLVGPVACGGAAGVGGMPAQQKVADAPPTYATIADAERDLARAEREIASLPGAQQGYGGPASTSAPPQDAVGGKGTATPSGGQPAQPTTPPPAASPPTAHADEAPKEERARPAPTPCENACRALASMSRAADAICRMAESTETDPRCISARKRVSDSAARAASCHCG